MRSLGGNKKAKPKAKPKATKQAKPVKSRPQPARTKKPKTSASVSSPIALTVAQVEWDDGSLGRITRAAFVGPDALLIELDYFDYSTAWHYSLKLRKVAEVEYAGQFWCMDGNRTSGTSRAYLERGKSGGYTISGSWYESNTDYDWWTGEVLIAQLPGEDEE